MAIFHFYDVLKSNTSNNYLVYCNSDTKYGHLNHFMKDYDKSNTYTGTHTHSDRTPPQHTMSPHTELSHHH
jgi:tRNA U34 2-thiouridine synthase MnmA/TrmU